MRHLCMQVRGASRRGGLDDPLQARRVRDCEGGNSAHRITSSWLVECVSSRSSGDGGHLGQRGADCSVGSFRSEGDALDCN